MEKTYSVYAQTEEGSNKTWLIFSEVTIYSNAKRKYLGRAITNFPVKYPLTLLNGVVINENDYYREQNQTK